MVESFDSVGRSMFLPLSTPILLLQCMGCNLLESVAQEREEVDGDLEGDDSGECQDLRDNDSNGAADCADPNCQEHRVCYNTPPVLNWIQLGPDPLFTDSIVLAETDSTDWDGDSVQLHFEWYVEGTLVASGPEDRLNGGAEYGGGTYFEKGQSVYAIARPSDGLAEGPTLKSAALAVSNTAPSPPAVSLFPPAPIAGADSLTCIVDGPAADPDSDYLGYRFLWSSPGGDSVQDVSTHSLGDSLDTSLLYPGIWTCKVWADDGEQSSESAVDSVEVQ
jgi:hypothetical protein